jgi:hypothetical protein
MFSHALPGASWVAAGNLAGAVPKSIFFPIFKHGAIY